MFLEVEPSITTDEGKHVADLLESEAEQELDRAERPACEIAPPQSLLTRARPTKWSADGVFDATHCQVNSSTVDFQRQGLRFSCHLRNTALGNGGGELPQFDLNGRLRSLVFLNREGCGAIR